MIEHVLVWFLLVRIPFSYMPMPSQFGPYSTLQDCKRIQESPIITYKGVTTESQCIQVSVPVQTLPTQQGVKK